MSRKIAPYDILVIVGLISLAAGLWWVYPPAALIAIGALLIAAGIVGFIRSERNSGQSAS